MSQDFSDPQFSSELPSQGLQKFEDSVPEQDIHEEVEAAPADEPESDKEEEVEFSGDPSDYAEEEHELFEGEDEPPPVKSKRAQKRFQQLANQKKELSQENEQLKQLVEQLKRQADFQEKQQNTEQAKQQEAQKLQQLEDYGFDPKDPRSYVLFEQMQRTQQLEQELNKFRQQRVIEDFNRNLESSLTAKVSAFDVPDEVKTKMMEIAYDRALARDLTAEQAASDVFESFSSVLPKRTKSNSSRKVVSEGAKVVSQLNKTRGAPPPTEKMEDLSFDDMLKKYF